MELQSSTLKSPILDYSQHMNMLFMTLLTIICHLYNCSIESFVTHLHGIAMLPLFLSDRWSVDYFEEETQELQSMLEKTENKMKDAQDAPEDFKKKMDEFIEV